MTVGYRWFSALSAACVVANTRGGSERPSSKEDVGVGQVPHMTVRKAGNELGPATHVKWENVTFSTRTAEATAHIERERGSEG